MVWPEGNDPVLYHLSTKPGGSCWRFWKIGRDQNFFDFRYRSRISQTKVAANNCQKMLASCFTNIKETMAKNSQIE
jgi:hypothetical protein